MPATLKMAECKSTFNDFTCVDDSSNIYVKEKFREIEHKILEKYDDDEVDVKGESTPNITGYLEVEVDGKLVHSKKNGDGYVDSKAKWDKIMSAIQEAVAKA